jgi:hypothetical protein
MSGFLGLFSGSPNPTVAVKGNAVVANAEKFVKKKAHLVGDATNVCAAKLTEVGQKIGEIAKFLEQNTPAAVNVAVAAANDLRGTATVKAMTGGRRASVISNAAVAGGARRYLKAAVRTLKQLGGNATKAGKALPGAVVTAAQELNEQVKKNVTPASVNKAAHALEGVVESYNSAAIKANSSLGTSAPNFAVTPVPAKEVVTAANNAAAAILNSAKKAAKNNGNYNMKGGSTLKAMFNGIVRGGAKTKKQGKKGGFFTFTPFNPNASPMQEGFALAGVTSRAGKVTMAKPPPPPPKAPAPGRAPAPRR